MRDQALARLLARLLPRRVARELFEPAWCDLHAEHVRTGDGRRGAWRHGAAVLLLYLDCWRLAAADLPRALRASRSRCHASSDPELTSMLLYHLRHAVRRLVREPAFTIAAVLTLALGVGANVAVFAVVEAVLLRPLPYPAPGELVTLHHRDQRTGITKEFVAIGDYVDIVARQSAFASVAAWGKGEATVYGTGEPYQISVLQGTSSLFDVLRARPALGRALTRDDDLDGAAPVMLLGYELWQHRFGGDPRVIGRSLKVGSRQRTIVGVAPPGLTFYATRPADAILSMTMPTSPPQFRKNGWTFLVARLKPGRTLADASNDLAALSRRMEAEHPQDNAASTYFPMPLRDTLLGNARPAFGLLLAAVAVVLLIACVNVANLLLARALGRRTEMALRMALGAGRRRLAVQLLAESLVLSVAACALGLVVAQWGAHALVTLVPESVNVPGVADVRLNAPVLAFAVGITLATTLAFGLMALLLVRVERARGVLVASGKSSMSAGARRATSTLVAVEVAFAVVLLVGAGLILKTFAGLLAVDPGFAYDHVVTAQIALPADRYGEDAARDAFWSRTFAAVRALPEVREIGAAAVVPLTGNNWTVPLVRADRPVPPGERPPEVGWQAASGGYFRALRIPLVTGRVFDATDRPGRPAVVVVSEALQRRYFPNERAVGKRLRLGDATAEIVGVVGDIRRAGLRDAPRADLYLPFEQAPPGQTTLFVRTTADPLHPLPSIRRAIRAIEPNAVVTETRTLADVASESVRTTKLLLWLLGIFAGLALALAVVGIYGVMSYAVRQRTREIGTRLALGAPRGAIVRRVMLQGAGIAGIGAVVGLAFGAVATRFLGALLYGTSALDPVVFLGAPLVLIAATLLACWLPARRAASVDPAHTLKQP